mgnify:FL=1
MKRSLLAFALFLPCAARAESSRARRYYHEEIHQPFFRLDASSGAYVSQRPGALPSSFSARKGTATFRVCVLGGSIAYKYLQGSRSIEPALRRALPGRKVEVLKCGMPGYDSHRERLLLQEVLGYSPDRVILLTGHNERLSSPPAPAWKLALRDRVSRVAALRAALDLLAKRPPPAAEDPAAAAREREEDFEKNLLAMLLMAKEKGVPLLLALPPLNYRDAPTRYPELGPVFVRGWIPFLKGSFEEASRAWEEALSSEPLASGEKSAVLFYLGRALEALGRQEEANRRYEEAVEEDSLWPGRCTPGRRRLIRRLAEREGAPIADLDAVFRGMSAPRLPGLDLFDSAVHWHHRHDAAVTRALLLALGEDPGPEERARGAGGLARGEAARVLWAGLADSAVEARPFRSAVYVAAVRAARPDWFADPARLARRAEVSARPAEAEAWGQPPLRADLARLRWTLGHVRLLRSEFAAAALDFEEALRLDPSLPLHLENAVSLAFSGRAEAAARSLERLRGFGAVREAEEARRALGL